MKKELNETETKRSAKRSGMARRITALVLAGVLTFGGTATVSAATLRDVFDAQYYYETYSDLKDAFGTNQTALYKHYKTFGKSEGRTSTALIDVQKYRAAYPDLDAAFGDNWDAYVNHYIKYGFSEGRNSFGTFDARAYADRYPDLKAAFGYDVLALYKHYLQFGRAEGRDASAAVAATTSSYTESSYSGSSNTGSADNGNNTSTNTAPIRTNGRLTNPETGAPVAGATVTFRLTSFNATAEEVEAATESVETTTETTETTESTETTEATETTESTEATETTEATESTEATETTEPTEATESTEATEATESTEATETTESTEATETTESTEATESTEETEEPENGLVVGDGYYEITTDANGYYEIPEFVPGVYSVQAAAVGYLTLTVNSISINADNGSFTLPTFQLLSSDMSGVNTVAGVAKNATTGLGIEGVTVNVRANWNNQSGDVIATTTTDADGNYSFSLERGYYTLEFARDGFVSTFVNVASSNAIGACEGVLSPTSTSEVTSTEFRIVLTWGETPRDLDSHLVGLDDANSVFHIAYYNKVERDTDGNVIASLDVDDVSSYGPETVTIVNARTDATYYYSVKDFTDRYDATSTKMSESGANVKVYQGSVLVKEYNVPLNQAGTIWNVFKIENGSVVDINNYNADETTMYGEYASEYNY